MFLKTHLFVKAFYQSMLIGGFRSFVHPGEVFHVCFEAACGDCFECFSLFNYIFIINCNVL